MNPDSITAVIRPRSAWEATDLGLAMVRRDWWRIMLAWAVTVFPLWVVIVVLLRNHPGWAMFVIWWLTPLYDRVPLFVISGALFDARPRLGQVLKAWPKLLFSKMHVALLTGRITMQRSFDLPVTQLEGLSGSTRRSRLAILNREGGSQASNLTFGGIMILISVFIWLMVLFGSVIPDGDSIWAEKLGFGMLGFEDDDLMPNSVWWYIVSVYMLALTLVEPFYVGGGFGLYLNSRTHLEGWDIELTFKRMSSRLAALKNGVKKSAALMVLGFLFLSGGAGETLAQEDSFRLEDEDIVEYSEPKELITKIKADPDFEIHTKMERVEKGKPNRRNGSGVSASLFQGLGTVLAWLAVAALVAGLVYVIYLNRHLFMFSCGEILKEEPKPARMVMGMDLKEQSLPRDIAAEARRLWMAGDVHEALRLLYRGSLAWLVNRAQLPVRESDTESDCLLHVRHMGDNGRAEYFEALTNSWVNLAYGKLVPSSDGMESLLSGWPFVGGRIGAGKEGGESV